MEKRIEIRSQLAGIAKADDFRGGDKPSVAGEVLKALPSKDGAERLCMNADQAGLTLGVVGAMSAPFADTERSPTMPERVLAVAASIKALASETCEGCETRGCEFMEEKSS